MKKVIIYDLKDKSNSVRSRIIQKLFGYKDNSNYDYSYERKGLLDGLKFTKETKTVLEFTRKKDVEKAVKLLDRFDVRFRVYS